MSDGLGSAGAAGENGGHQYTHHPCSLHCNLLRNTNRFIVAGAKDSNARVDGFVPPEQTAGSEPWSRCG
jgi:hypothetical protein